MQIDTNIDYKQSIKFEMLRSEIAFSEFYKMAEVRLSNPDLEPPSILKIHHFDTYARWCGHMYEVFKAFLILSPNHQITKNCKDSTKFDLEMQKEASNIITSMTFSKGEVLPVLNASFADDLRTVRNKCSFHCTAERSEIGLLQNFLKQHHQVLLVIFMHFKNVPEYIGVDDVNSYGEIEKFFKLSTLINTTK